MRTTDSGHDPYTIKPVHKALRTLLCLGDGSGGATLAEICRRTGLPKTSVFKYLFTLRAEGFVSYDPQTERYRLGMRLWELGRSVEKDLEIRRAALPSMYWLRDRFDETVNLGVLDGSEVVYIGMVESRRSLRMRAELGGRDPVYSTALGKVMLASLPGESWRRHLPDRLEPRTDRTHTSLRSLKQDLELTRERGFALDRGENEEGARCVGATVCDRSGRMVGAVSLSAPELRVGDALEPEVAAAVMQAAAGISERLDHRTEATVVGNT